MADSRGAGPDDGRGRWARDAATWLIAGLGLLLCSITLVLGATLVLTFAAEWIGVPYERLVAFIAVSWWGILQSLRILTRWSNTP